MARPAAATRDAVIRRARHGELLATTFPPPRSAAAGRRRRRRVVVPPLGLAERERVLDTFATLVEGLYADLPLKRARYASDPLQRLRLLRQRAALVDDLSFHYELATIITELRDAHTRYIGPASLEGRAAMLPFLVEGFGAPPEQRYVVSKVADDPELIGDPFFVPGVELRWWNAVPMDLAVDRQADHETGGRPDSRRARALESLTLRALQYGPPPDEHWVIVGYVDLEEVERESRFDWRIVTPRRARTAQRTRPEASRAYAIDASAEVARRVKKLLFVPDAWYDDLHGAPTRGRRETPTASGYLPTDFQDTLAAREVQTPSGRFGYLRIWSFDVADDVAFVDEVVRLLGLLPDRGVIVDLRANPGGLIWAAERLLQLFTPRRVVPTRFSLLATPLTRAMAEAQQNEGELRPWRVSLDAAVASGELYSQAVPITPIDGCNDIGQVYGGPVVAVVDANTYSAGDLFAAGFYDNDLGLLVTVGDATGAGGANVWSPEDVQDALLGTVFELAQLPAGIGYTLSVRRATRAGDADGTAIEDIGVHGHRTYSMTRRDLTDGNVDLLAFCGRLLAGRPSSVLRVDVDGDGVEIATKGLDRVDVFVDGRPIGWHEVASRPLRLPRPEGDDLELLGYAGDQLLQRRRTHLA